MSPKELIFSQLRNKFEKIGLQKIMIQYNLKENKTFCSGFKDSQVINIEVSKTENLLINKMLVSKIQRIVTINFDLLIIKIELSNEKINMYIRNSQTSELLPFEF